MHSILIVEDEQVQRDVLSEKMKAEGFTVYQAADGESGLKTAFEQSPDIILLDNRMPTMTGYQMLRRLRDSSPWGEKVPVIFFSNVEPTSKDEKADLDAIAPTAYLLKSESGLADIVAKVKETLGV